MVSFLHFEALKLYFCLEKFAEDNSYGSLQLSNCHKMLPNCEKTGYLHKLLGLNVTT